MKKFLAVAIMILALATVCFGEAYDQNCPSNWFVKTDGNDTNEGHSWTTALKNINTAVTNCVSGDTIIVGPGTYAEEVNLCTKKVKLVCPNKYGARITPGSNLQPLIIGGGNIIEGIWPYTSSATVPSCYTNSGVSAADGIEIRNCQFYGGKYAFQITNAYIHRLHIYDSTFRSPEYGIYWLGGFLVSDLFMDRNVIQITGTTSSNTIYGFIVGDCNGVIKNLIIDVKGSTAGNNAKGLVLDSQSNSHFQFDNLAVFMNTGTARTATVIGIEDLSSYAGCTASFNNCFVSVVAPSSSDKTAYKKVSIAGGSPQTRTLINNSLLYCLDGNDLWIDVNNPVYIANSAYNTVVDPNNKLIQLGITKAQADANFTGLTPVGIRRN